MAPPVNNPTVGNTVAVFEARLVPSPLVCRCAPAASPAAAHGAVAAAVDADTSADIETFVAGAASALQRLPAEVPLPRSGAASASLDPLEDRLTKLCEPLLLLASLQFIEDSRDVPVSREWGPKVLHAGDENLKGCWRPLLPPLLQSLLLVLLLLSPLLWLLLQPGVAGVETLMPTEIPESLRQTALLLVLLPPRVHGVDRPVVSTDPSSSIKRLS